MQKQCQLQSYSSFKGSVILQFTMGSLLSLTSDLYCITCEDLFID